MAPTPTRRLRALKQEQYTNPDSWGAELNVGALDIIDKGFGTSEVAVNANVTLTAANFLDDQSRSIVLILTGTGGFQVTAPAVDKPYLVVNNCAADVTMKPSGGTAATIRAGIASWYYTNAAGSVGAVFDPTLDKIKAPAANVSMNAKKLTNVAPATAATDAASLANTLDQFTAPNAPVSMNGMRLTGVGTATLGSDAVPLSQFNALFTGSAVETVAGINGQVVTVAGISSSVVTVAANASSVSTVAASIGNVNFVAANMAAIIAASLQMQSLVRVARTSNTQIVAANKGNLIDITSGTFTQTFAAAATLGAGWWGYIRNAGTGDITLDPNGAETIDGLTSFIMYPGEMRLVICDGTALRSVVFCAFTRVFDASGTFIRPPGYGHFGFRLHAGGGGGAKRTSSQSAIGGSAGAVFGAVHVPVALISATMAVTVGAGGIGASTVGNDGGAGGNTSLDGFIAVGGPGGTGSTVTDTYGQSNDAALYVSTRGGSIVSSTPVAPVTAGPAAFTGGLASVASDGSPGTGIGAGGGGTTMSGTGKAGDGFRGQAHIWGEI